MSSKLPELYKVYPGEVRRLAPYGCFVSIVGFETDGLLHISQLGNARVEKVEDVASVGDRFFVKVHLPNTLQIIRCKLCAAMMQCFPLLYEEKGCTFFSMYDCLGWCNF